MRSARRLSALMLFADTRTTRVAGKLQILAADPAVIIGLFMAASSLSLRRDGNGSGRRAAVRSWSRAPTFRRSRIMEAPEPTTRAVDMLTRAAIREMIIPRCSRSEPVIVGFG